jgi:hypothetical protein
MVPKNIVRASFELIRRNDGGLRREGHGAFLAALRGCSVNLYNQLTTSPATWISSKKE